MSLVLDSSATLAWIYSDETTETIRQLFVPSLMRARSFRRSGGWRWPIVSTVAVRRGPIDAGFRRAALYDLALLDIATDDHTDTHAWAETLLLADRFGLTLYDCLSQAGAPPCTAARDARRDLGAAAAALDLHVLGGGA